MHLTAGESEGTRGLPRWRSRCPRRPARGNPWPWVRCHAGARGRGAVLHDRGLWPTVRESSVFRAQPDRVSTPPEIFGSVATRVSSPRPVLPASRNLRRPLTRSFPPVSIHIESPSIYIATFARASTFCRFAFCPPSSFCPPAACPRRKRLGGTRYMCCVVVVSSCALQSTPCLPLCTLDLKSN